MARRLSRQSVAAHVAERLVAGDKEVIKQLAAYIVQNRQTRNIDLFVRDIEARLLSMGHATVDATSAFSLSDTTKAEIKTFIKEQTGANEVVLREHIDESVLGGVRLRTPGRELDSTLARKLTLLRTRLKKA